MPDNFDAELERYLHARLKSKSRFPEFFKQLWSPRIKEPQTTNNNQPTTNQTEPALQELRDLAQISLGVIRQLPDEELKLFKQSPEFAKLKEILKKHHLIR